jgi:hypothetical protein
MKHTVTAADVKRIHAANVARGKTPAEARQGARTEVHELLQAQLPVPYPLPARTKTFAAADTAARDADLANRTKAMQSQVTDAEILASERARGGADATHRDAHHWVQKQHGIALWQETDRLIAEALGGAS